MKKHRKKTGHRFKSTVLLTIFNDGIIRIEAGGVCRLCSSCWETSAPDHQEKRLGPAAAQLLLSQLAQLLGGVFLVSADVDESRREAHSENGQGGEMPKHIYWLCHASSLFARASLVARLHSIGLRTHVCNFSLVCIHCMFFIPIQRLYCQLWQTCKRLSYASVRFLRWNVAHC